MRRQTHTMASGITTVLLLLLCVVAGTAVAQQSAGSQYTPASSPVAVVIPVEEVATQATEVSQLLRTLSAQVVPSPAIDALHRVLPEASGTIDLELAATSTMLQGQPTLELLQTQQQAVTGLLGRDGLPLWRRALWTEARSALPERVRQVATAYWSDILHYVRDPAEGLPLHAGLFLVLAFVFGAARRQVQRWQAAGEAASSALRVFQYPVAAALLITLLIATSPFAQIPLTVREVFQIVGLLPMLLLTQPVVAASVVPGLYALGGLFTFDIVLQALYLVRHHRDRLERRLSHVLVWLVVLSWVGRYLNYVGLLEPVLSSGYAVLMAKLERGTISLSVGDILAFGLTVLGAYLLSTFLRFVLDEDVYPRMRITAGQSYAVSSLLHYIVLALGFVVGLGLLGMDLTRVTVLVGALGVGIGFGMQSVVNNFVSGLILLFERPIHVGDAVELGAVQGVVRRIGIRASVVHTWQGADIIVPNSHLVTEQVTNWMLTDQLRRIDLPVGVNYGAVPQQVIALLEGVARAHPQVLPDPPPQAFFMGYGDSAINFTLFAWPDHFNHWGQVKSDLTAAVYEAVVAAGMSFPFPQREVRVLHEAEAAIAPINAAHKTERADT